MVKLIKRGKRLGLVAMASFLAMTLVVSACAPARALAGSQEKVVKVGWDGILTGPLADTGVSATNGLKDCARFINERGGINGVEIIVDWEDTRGEIPRTITAHKRLKERGVLIEVNIVLGTVEANMRSILRDEIPMLMVTGHSDLTLAKDDQGLRWVFTLFPSYRAEGWAPATWLKENWTEERPPRAGAMLYDHISALEGGEGFKIACKELGIEFVGTEIVPWTGAIDTTTEWLRLAAKKPDMVFVGDCGVTLVTNIKTAKRLEIMERGIKLVHVEHCFDDALHVVGKDAEGWYVFRPFPSATADADLRGMKIMLEKAEEYRGWEPEKVEGSYIPGWIAMTVMEEAFRLAIEKVGYDNLSGRAVRDGLASIKGFDCEGLMPPITLSDKHPYACERIRLYQIREGKFSLVSDKWYPYPIMLDVD